MYLDFKFNADDVIKENRCTEEGVEKIKKWLVTGSAKFVPSQIQDEFVVLFLLSCNNDIDLTKNTISSYYKLRKDCPEFFDNRKPAGTDIQKAFNTMRMAPIPMRTDTNDAIIYIRLRDTDYNNFELLPVMKATFMILDLLIEGNPSNGIVYIVDMQGFGLMHLTKLRPEPLKKYFIYLGEGLPTKLKAIHFLNANYFLDRLLALISRFIKPDIMKRIHMHPTGLSTEKLFKIIPKKCLPKELGGDLQAEEELCRKTNELIRDKEQFWDTEEKLRKCVL